MAENGTRAEHEERLFRKLNISVVDLNFARHHAHQILAKKLYRPQTKGQGQGRYAVQVAFVTALVAAYGRAFAPTRGNPQIPEKLTGYNCEENALHEELLNLRNELCAHSDDERFLTLTPVRSMTIQMVPFYCIKRENIKLFLAMTKRVRMALYRRADKLHPNP
jgi:hypothetical protein